MEDLKPALETGDGVSTEAAQISLAQVGSPHLVAKEGIDPHEANHEPELAENQACLGDSRKFGTNRFGYCLDQGERLYMEDAVEVIPNLGDFMSSEYYAVYDGHGGDGAVKFVKSRLSSLVRSHQALSSKSIDDCRNASDMEQAFRECFTKVDDEYLNLLFGREAQQNSSVDRPALQRTTSVQGEGLSPGCVACVALVCASTLYVASIGDCRACLCVSHDDEPAKCEDLTSEHTALEDKNADEHRRVIEAGAWVSSDGYLNGKLAVSRSFGDWDWECSEKCLGLICQPDVVIREIDADTEFLLLASDGIFEKMSPLAAIRTVRRHLRKPGNCDPSNAAEVLINEAKQLNSTDNLSAIVVLFKAPKPEERRAANLFRGALRQPDS